MTNEQKEAYALHVRIEEITQLLKIDHVVPANPHRRSPSPDPVYNTAGQRINTRYIRHRQRLERERHTLIQQAFDTIPGYRPPRDYKKGLLRAAVEEKVFIPNKEFPELNFIGQLLGPRGRTLKEMNYQSGANIVIRGKESVKEGRSRITRNVRYGNDNLDEPLHCLITSTCQEKAAAARKLVEDVVQDVITVPDHANERKRGQLRALAVANGTFRDDERCGRGPYVALAEHQREITCRSCGNGGHLVRDCLIRRGGRQAATSVPPGALPPWRRDRGSAQMERVELECQQFLDTIDS